MRKLTERTGILLLIYILFFCSVTSASSDGLVPTPEEAYERIIELKSEYREGKSWSQEKSYDSEAGLMTGTGPFAFTLILSDAAFGNQPFTVMAGEDKDDIRVGDILKTNDNTRSAIVLKRKGDVLTVAEVNTNNRIHWGRQIYLSRFTPDFYYTRYQTSETVTDDSATDKRPTSSKEMMAIHRLYNPESGEHIFSGSASELAALSKNNNWVDEGVAWYAPVSGDPVYRLHNNDTKVHFYTINPSEIDSLVNTGTWGVDFNSQPAFYSGGTIPVYRVYDSSSTLHQYTSDSNEYNSLENRGWSKEGTALKAVKISDVPLNSNSGTKVSQVNTTVDSPSNASGQYSGISNVSSEYSIEADVRLNGSGSGFHAKLVAGTATSAVSFGIQYDDSAPEPYAQRTAFLFENIAHNNAGGQNYTRAGFAELNKNYRLLLTVKKSGVCEAFVNGQKVGSVVNPELAGRSDILLHVEGAGRLNGDSVNAVFNGIKLKSDGIYDSGDRWSTEVVDTNVNIHSNNNYSTTGTVSIIGSVSGLSPDENWDNAYDSVSGNVVFHKQ